MNNNECDNAELNEKNHSYSKKSSCLQVIIYVLVILFAVGFIIYFYANADAANELTTFNTVMCSGIVAVPLSIWIVHRKIK